MKLEDVGQWLVDNVLDKNDDNKAASDVIRMKISEVSLITHRFTQESNNRRTRLDAMIRDAESFEDTLKQFETWLVRVEKPFSKDEAIPVVAEELKQQTLELKVRF